MRFVSKASYPQVIGCQGRSLGEVELAAAVASDVWSRAVGGSGRVRIDTRKEGPAKARKPSTSTVTICRANDRIGRRSDRMGLRFCRRCASVLSDE